MAKNKGEDIGLHIKGLDRFKKHSLLRCVAAPLRETKNLRSLNEEDELRYRQKKVSHNGATLRAKAEPTKARHKLKLAIPFDTTSSK